MTQQNWSNFSLNINLCVNNLSHLSFGPVGANVRFFSWIYSNQKMIRTNIWIYSYQIMILIWYERIFVSENIRIYEYIPIKKSIQTIQIWYERIFVSENTRIYSNIGIFVTLWSKTSYSGDKRTCYQAGQTNDKRQTREDRATQPLGYWKAEFRISIN